MGSIVERSELLRRKVRDAVLLFEHKEGSKQVDLKEIGTLVRSLGYNPSPSQVNAILEQLSALQGEGGGGGGDDRLTNLLPLEHIENVVSAYLMSHEGDLVRDDYHLLIRAFRVFDSEGKGYVLAEQMRSILSARGEEPLTEDELSKMIGRSADENGKIYYEDVSQRLVNDGRII